MGNQFGSQRKKKAGAESVISANHLHLAHDNNADEPSDSEPDEQHNSPRILTEDEKRLLAHHPGTPDDHQHYYDAPLDRKAEKMLRKGSLDEVLSLAEMAPTRVAAAMGRNRLVLEHLGHSRQMDKLLTLTWDTLDDRSRQAFLSQMLKRIMDIVHKTEPSETRKTGNMTSSPFIFNCDELDIEASMERIITRGVYHQGRPVPASYDDLRIRERLTENKAYAILIDVSRSMQGSKVIVAALASVVLSLNLKPDDELTIITFSEKAQVLRPLSPGKIDYETILSILELRPEGCTDVYSAIESGLEQLEDAVSSHRIGILLSDGWQNTGKDPSLITRAFSNFHVLELPGGDHSLCLDMAAIGQGYLAVVDQIEDIPDAINCFLAH